METINIVVAGRGFQTIDTALREALPGARPQMTDVETLRLEGAGAPVLIPTMSRIDGPLMDRIEGLRLIQQFGAGLEGVDVAAASERGIAVANVPTGQSGNADSVAEWCLMSAIAISRQLPVALRGIREGASWGAPTGRALMGRTATVIGLGGIGQALVARLQPMGMRILGVKGRPDQALKQRLGLDWLGGPEDLEEALRQSDYVFLCLPLTQDSRHLINARTLAMLPAGAAIINPGRGGLVDEKALRTALDAGHLMAAALDVYETEPLSPDSPLLAYDQLLATPHIAGVTDISYRGIAAGVAENVRRILSGRAPNNCVNPEVMETRGKSVPLREEKHGRGRGDTDGSEAKR